MKVDSLYKFAVILFFIIGCQANDNTSKLYSRVIEIFPDSLDLNRIVGKQFKVLSKKIRNGKMIGLARNVDNDSVFFVIINLKEKKLERLMKSMHTEYYNILFDFDNDKVVSAKINRPCNLIVQEINSNVIYNINIPPINLFATDIILNGSQLFYIHGITGLAVVNLTKPENIREFKNYKEISNPFSTSVSLPVYSDINLYLGHTISYNETRLYAIDHNDSINWFFNLKQIRGNTDVIESITYPNVFVVKYDSNLVAFDKVNGKVVWQIHDENFITKIYSWNEDVLTLNTLKKSMFYPESDTVRSNVVFKLYEASTGKIKWTYSSTSIGDYSIGLGHNSLLYSDRKTIFTLDLKNGVILSTSPSQNNHITRSTFETLIDLSTGKYYLITSDEKIYW